MKDINNIHTTNIVGAWVEVPEDEHWPALVKLPSDQGPILVKVFSPELRQTWYHVFQHEPDISGELYDKYRHTAFITAWAYITGPDFKEGGE